MKEEKTTRLRQRMIEDMDIRGLGEKTHKAQIRNVKMVCRLPRADAGHRHARRPTGLAAAHGQGRHLGQHVHGRGQPVATSLSATGQHQL